MNFNLLKKNLKFEISYRLKLSFIIIILIMFILFNLMEHINNYLFFYTEINLNEIEYIYYNNLYYNNNLNINIIEYDWYINYNIFPINFLNTKNILIYIYASMIFFFTVPYILYEIYLFLIPALYFYEKKKIKIWIIYTFIYILFYLIYIDKTSSDFFFYWNEDSYIYLYNEWIDIFFNINNISNLYMFNLFFFIILSQFIFFYLNFIKNYNKHIILNKKIRIIINVILFIILIFLYLFIKIEVLFLLKYIIIQFITTEFLLYARSFNFFYYKAK